MTPITNFRLATIAAIGAAVLTLVSACSGSATPTEPPTSPGESDLAIASTGIGTVDIGQPPGAALAELNAFFGEPDVDTGWIPPASPLYGTCPGVELRAVGWGSLFLFFVADEPISADAAETGGRLYSFSYGYDFIRNEGATDPRSLALVTDAGVGLGTTRADLETAYSGLLDVTYDAAADVWMWSVAAEGSGRIQGLLSGSDDEAQVVLIERAPGCEIS